MTIDLRGRLTLTVPEAGQLLGIGRDAAYAAAERGDLDCIEVGRRKVVPTHALLRRVGWPDELIAAALGVNPAATPDSTNGEPDSPPSASIRVLTPAKTGGPHHAPNDAG